MRLYRTDALMLLLGRTSLDQAQRQSEHFLVLLRKRAHDHGQELVLALVVDARVRFCPEGIEGAFHVIETVRGRAAAGIASLSAAREEAGPSPSVMSKQV